jgi:hypothetical protein
LLFYLIAFGVFTNTAQGFVLRRAGLRFLAGFAARPDPLFLRDEYSSPAPF